MYTTSILSFLALSCLSSQAVSALPAFEELGALDRRNVCNADNCLRALRATAANQAPPSSFCQSYLSTTPIAISTSYTTIISTPAAPTITSYVTSTSTDIDIESTTIYVKRAATTPFSAAISSACPSANGLDQCARLSSACSCFLGGSASTETVLLTSTVHSTAATPPAITVTSFFLATSTVSTCSGTSTTVILVTSSAVAATTSTLEVYTTSTTTPAVCAPTPTISNGNFESGSLSPWGYNTESDNGASDSTVSISAPENSNGNEGNFVANFVLGTDQDNSITFTNTVYGLCAAGNQFRVNFDYWCQAQNYYTSIAAYIDGNELYASSCNFPGSWQTDNLLYFFFDRAYC
ncbi:hypothetical protein N431DRAFT_473854 [Stipitochalara longipes BDJ]|nr:hypothetical protein N431DRAFT_473854 [Stipitochalara longipes BDJ]